ncbi:MAG TPA: cupredoxin domain-containing protein [Thermomicrobiales bacterium]|nr:cupredoxin domain-containing protein [Thermomicrobiales bacterium]
MLRKFIALVSISMIALLFVAACGDDDDAAATPGATGAGDAVPVQMLDTMRFDPDTISVSAGSEVTIALENPGAIPHSFTIDEADVDVELDAGESETFTFTAPSEPGEYEIYCKIAGHREAGMVATLVVE